MGNVSPVTNNRKYPRQRVLRAGKIVSSTLTTAVNVTIGDMSAGGARIRTSANINFPEVLGLMVVSERRLYPVVARWRKGEWVGIEFVGEPQHTTLRKLEAPGSIREVMKLENPRTLPLR